MKKQGRKLTIAWTIVIALVFALLMGGAATPKQGPHIQPPVQDTIICGCGEEPVTPEAIK